LHPENGSVMVGIRHGHKSFGGRWILQGHARDEPVHPLSGPIHWRYSRPMQGFALFLLLIVTACATRQPADAQRSDTAPSSATGKSPGPTTPTPRTETDAQASPLVAPDEEAIETTINDRFLDPKLDVDRWKKSFEGESREVFAARNEVLAALDLKPGQSVADVGAGTGFYLWAFAESVGPKGHVYGVEISPRFLDSLRKDAATKNITNATIVTGTERSIELPENSVDLIFVCDTYHHFAYPQTTLASMRQALRPGGSLVVIDFHRITGESSKWTLQHVRGSEQEFRSEIEAAGFAFDTRHEIAGFQDNYMIRFRAGE